MNLPLDIIGGILLLFFLYYLSVRILIMVLHWQELGKGYEDTGHPEHDAWAQKRGSEQALGRACDRAFGSPILGRYCFVFVFFHNLFTHDEEDF